MPHNLHRILRRDRKPLCLILGGSTGARTVNEAVWNNLDVLTAADVVVTRCGSNAILETLALGKKTVCIPLPSKSSRGEQEQNAAFAVSHRNAVLLKEQVLNGASLCGAIGRALALDSEMPFKITREQLVSNIEAHAEEIYHVGQEKGFRENAKGRGTVNFMELSNHELEMYDEIVSVYGDEW